MILYDGMQQVQSIDDRLREQLNLFLREYLSLFFSDPQHHNANIAVDKLYHAVYYAAVGGWVKNNPSVFLDLLCPNTATSEDEGGDLKYYCALDEIIYDDYPASVLRIAEHYQDELRQLVGLPGIIQTMFPGRPLEFFGDDATRLVVGCEHFTF